MTPTDTTTAKTEQEHHMKAAEHLELAAKSHKDAAKMVGAGDHKGATQHVEMAKKHIDQFNEHLLELKKKVMPSPKKSM